jgi:hypothetical protein
MSLKKKSLLGLMLIAQHLGIDYSCQITKKDLIEAIRAVRQKLPLNSDGTAPCSLNCTCKQC